MKHSGFKNSFSAIKPKTNNESVTNYEEEYTEVVTGTETYSSSKRIMRIVSSVAAAAVLVTGIGATGFMLHKNKNNKAAQPEENVVSTEPDDIIDPSEVASFADITDSGAVAPFVDFKQIYFSLQSVTSGASGDYSDETYEKLTVFLNNFNWGEGNNIAESDIPDFKNIESDALQNLGCIMDWHKGDVWSYLYITKEGKAYYVEEKCTPEGHNFYYPVVKSLVFNIDYELFDKGIQYIVSSNVSDTGDYLSYEDKKYLTQGEFLNGEVQSEGGSSLGEIVPKSDKTAAALQGFLREDFVGMLQNDKSLDYGSDSAIYTVACYYKTSSTTTRRLTYYIHSSGLAGLCEYELTGDDEIPTGCSNYYIDINAFESVLNDILNGKYDDKYSFEENTSIASENINETAEMAMTENENAAEEETQEQNVSKELTDEE